MQKTTLIIDNIITPYIIARYNAINDVLGGNLLVIFQAKSEKNRHWKNFPSIRFKYQFLDDFPIKIGTKDSHTFHINMSIVHYLKKNSTSLSRVIICGWDSLTYWFSAIFCKINGIQLTLWSGSTQYEESWRRTLFMPIILLIVNISDDYIAYGSRAKEFLIDLGAPAKKIATFINSVDVKYFAKTSRHLKKKKQTLRKKWNIPKNNFVFLYIGQLIERKGLLELLEAFSALSKFKKNVSLVLVGAGQLHETLKTRYQLNNKNLIILDYAEYSILPEIYSFSDAFVLPSQEEVWGLVINEALASSLPVVVSDRVGSGPDLVTDGKNGYTYQSGKVTQLLQAMQEIISNSTSLKRFAGKGIMETDPTKVAPKVFHGKTK